jgi:hypothetical protein
MSNYEEIPYTIREGATEAEHIAAQDAAINKKIDRDVDEMLKGFDK